jgi:hypothetical protein
MSWKYLLSILLSQLKKEQYSFFLINFHTITDCTCIIISKFSIIYHALSQIETTRSRAIRLILYPGQMYS